MSKNDVLPALIIVMGISGTGKSSIASLLAKRFGYRFIEADDFHDAGAKNQMSKGIGLSDEQRQEWVDRLSSFLSQLSKDNEDIVLAYSGLKARHRQQFRELPFNTDFVLLEGDETVIKSRIERRQGHFVDTSFLNSQLQDMEWPTENEHDVCTLNVDRGFELTYKDACLLFRVC